MKKIIYLLFTVCVLTFLTNCSKDDNRNSPEFQLKAADNLDDLDYRLYTLILYELFENTENLVVSQSTQPVFISTDQAYLQSLKDVYPDMDTTIYTDYILKNDTIFHLENKFSVASKQVILVSEEEIQYIFNNFSDINKGWEEFYRRFPDSHGQISFSRIGYNTRKTQAMVEMGNMYASLGGEGRLIFMVLENNEWIIIRAMPTWIS